MKNFRYCLALIVGSYFTFAAFAQTVSWQNMPQWDNVEMLGNNLVRVTKSGKQGVINLYGEQVLPCVCDCITNMRDQRFLVLNKENRILSIRDENGDQIMFNGVYYADEEWPYYSGGMLAVKGDKGRWGFLNMSGALSIACKYKMAFPFVCGQAAVKFGNDKCGHIATNGKPVYIKDQSLRSKKIDFASTITPVEGRQLSLVCIEGSMYLINPSGEVVSTQLVPSEGHSLYGSGINKQIVAGNITVRFNNIGEVDAIIKDGIIHNFTGLTEKKYDFPDIKAFNTFDGRSFSVGTLKTTSQFGEVAPLSDKTVLAEVNGKWGLIKVEQNKEVPSIKITGDYQQIKLDHASGINGTFTIQPLAPNTIVYLEMEDGKTVTDNLYDEGKDCLNVPLTYEEGRLKARIGLIMDGIKLESNEYSIVPVGFNKAFRVNCPSSLFVSDNGNVSFKLTVINTSEVQGTAPFDIRVDGRLVRRNITLGVGEEIDVPFSTNINLGIKDQVAKNVVIRISEQDCPVVSITKNIICKRKLKED